MVINTIGLSVKNILHNIALIWREVKTVGVFHYTLQVFAAKTSATTRPAEFFADLPEKIIVPIKFLPPR